MSILRSWLKVVAPSSDRRSKGCATKNVRVYGPTAIMPRFVSIVGVLIFAAQLAHAGGQSATRPVDIMLAEAASCSTLPHNCSFHFQTRQEFTHYSGGMPGLTGCMWAGNVFYDGEKIDVAELDSYVYGSTTRPSFANRMIWDGKWYLMRQQAVASAGAGLMFGASRQPTIGNGGIYREAGFGGFIDGILHYDHKPMAQILLDAGTAQIVGEETIDGDQCAVVMGKTPYGIYKLWLDEAAASRLRKADVTKGEGDLIPGNRGEMVIAPKGVLWKFSIDNLGIQEMQGQTVAVSGTMEEETHYPGGKFDISRFSTGRSRLDLAPDFAGKRAFIMDGIPEGTTVWIQDRDPNDHFAYIWKAGQVVKDDDRSTTKKIDSMISDERKAAQP